MANFQFDQPIPACADASVEYEGFSEIGFRSGTKFYSLRLKTNATMEESGIENWHTNKHYIFSN